MKAQKVRGLYRRRNKVGEECWYVRIAVHGRMETFATKGAATDRTDAGDRYDGVALDLAVDGLLRHLADQRDLARPEPEPACLEEIIGQSSASHGPV